jgi:hypothetical protein
MNIFQEKCLSENLELTDCGNLVDTEKLGCASVETSTVLSSDETCHSYCISQNSIQNTNFTVFLTNEEDSCGCSDSNLLITEQTDCTAENAFQVQSLLERSTKFSNYYDISYRLWTNGTTHEFGFDGITTFPGFKKNIDQGLPWPGYGETDVFLKNGAGMAINFYKISKNHLKIDVFNQSTYQWFGFQSEAFAESLAETSFEILFTNRKPQASTSGLSIFGNVDNSWIDSCEIGVWCFVDIMSEIGDSGNANLVVLTFDQEPSSFTFELKNFTITYYHEEFTTTQPLMTVPAGLDLDDPETEIVIQQCELVQLFDLFSQKKEIVSKK